MRQTATRLSRRAVLGTTASLSLGALLTACGGVSTAVSAQSPLVAVACEDFWGSIVAQIGGTRVTVANIIADPGIDPHEYEPKPMDARLFAGARYIVVNGAGYDPWASKLLGANPVSGRAVLTVADLLGKKDGDNPHFWYSPEYLLRVTDQVTANLTALDSNGAAYYADRRTQFLTVALQPYQDAIATIRQRYAGVPVGASESIFVYLAEALGLNLITPPGFLQAVNNGNDPTAQDKAVADAQITSKQIRVYVYNAQNTTPDVEAQKAKAQALGIAVVAITETPDPPTQSLQDWQTAQLRALQDALALATGA